MGKSASRRTAQQTHEQAHAQGYYSARELWQWLAAGRPPAQNSVWGVVLAPGEVLHYDVPAGYARLWGGDGTYRHTQGLFLGSAGFMAAGYAITALSNSRARAAAASNAQVRWREQQQARVLVTNQRLLCEAGGRWLSFYYSAIAGFYPELNTYTVVLDFEECEPLGLYGPSAPFLGVHLAWTIYGADGLRQHPGLAALRD